MHRPVKNLSIDSNANYQICVPETMKGHDIFFSVPFFRLCSKEDALKNQDGKTDFFGRYTIGKDAFLEGKNASELNGTEVTVRQAKTESFTGNNLNDLNYENGYYELFEKSQYINKILEGISDRYGKKTVTNKNRRKVKNYINRCATTTYVIYITLTCDGSISSNVEVTKLIIPSIGLNYNIQNFAVKIVKNSQQLVQASVADVDEFFDFESCDGITLNSGALQKVNYYELLGTAEKNLSSVELTSLNKDVDVLTKDQVHQMGISTIDDSNRNPKLLNVKKGKSVDNCVYYEAKNVSQNQDAYISSLLLTLKAKDGTESSKLIFQPTVIPGEDYVVKATKMYLDGKKG